MIFFDFFQRNLRRAINFRLVNTPKKKIFELLISVLNPLYLYIFYYFTCQDINRINLKEVQLIRYKKRFFVIKKSLEKTFETYKMFILTFDNVIQGVH